MKDLLFVRSLHVEKPHSKNNEDWVFKHEQVCGYIRMWVDDNVHNLVENEKNAKTLWNTLEKLYASNTCNNELYLLKQLINLRYSEGSSISNHILGLWLLNTLPDSRETFRVSHTDSAPGEKMSFDYAKNGILNEEIRMKTQGTSSQNEVMFIEQWGRNPNRDQETSEEDSIDHVAAATSDDLVIVSDDHDTNLVSSDICWVGDSSAAVYVTPRREFFSTYTVGDFSPLRTSNNGLAKVAGIENIHFKVKNGSTVLLRDVRHAPDVRLNLISIGRLDCDGYGNNFVDGKWKISIWSLILAKSSKLKENLYMLEASVSDDSVNVVGKQCSLELWHKRLSHISAKGLETLVKKNVLPGAQSSSFEKCSHCLEGKHNRVSFKTNPPHRQPNLLDLVHLDVCGPLKVKTNDSHSHDDLIDIDPSSIPHLPTTDDGNAVEAEMQLNDFADAQQDENLENPLMDRVRCMLLESKLPQSFWGEALCVDSYVINLTPPIALQGDVIRSRDVVFYEDQTIGDIDKVESSDSHSHDDLIDIDPSSIPHLPTTDDGNAVEAEIQLNDFADAQQDENLENPLMDKGDVPENVWTEKNTSYDHLRVFGCKAYIHVPRDERSKLDTKARWCILIGYGQDEFGYRLYDPVEKNVIRSRDVVFYEDQTIDDIDKVENDGNAVEAEMQLNNFADAQQDENLENPPDIDNNDPQDVEPRRCT
ncbi:hypothetical protein SASPL_141228 [Salvia splendens]|uniref:GAG-pre-integrase domain-containing protein n=1 Tax=Salvia splendens TaxID=180675 RepID=A0A8X8WRS6_SALSN|nr:hypothetical protein SASPL_141228 [Salvia splendens]